MVSPYIQQPWSDGPTFSFILHITYSAAQVSRPVQHGLQWRPFIPWHDQHTNSQHLIALPAAALLSSQLRISEFQRIPHTRTRDATERRTGRSSAGHDSEHAKVPPLTGQFA
jgi:hypothetical protein